MPRTNTTRQPKRPRKQRSAGPARIHSKIPIIAVQLASDTAPIPPTVRDAAIHRAQTALQLATSTEPNHITHWMSICDAINIMGTLVELGAATDAHGIIEAAEHAVKTAIDRKHTTGRPTFDGCGLRAVADAIDSYPAILEQLTHKAFMYALRETDLRLRTQAQRPRKGTVIIKLKAS